MNPQKHGIILNRMYDGKYLQKNLGHEIINLFTTDQEKHYIYLNDDGKLSEDMSKNIVYDKMLLIKRHCEGVIEIVGKATGLEPVYVKGENQNESEKIQKITYGGVSVTKIFQDDQYQDILVTYQAKEVYRPENRMFIFLPSTKKQVTGEESIKAHVLSEQKYILDRGYKIAQLNTTVQALQSQRQYIKQMDIQRDDYHQLLNAFFTSNEGWEKLEEKHKINLDQKGAQEDNIDETITLFDICKIQDNEVCFTNALAYFIRQEKYKKLWLDFFGINSDIVDVQTEKDATVKDIKIGEKVHNEEQYNTGGFIDIFIKCSDGLILIENKIKSNINKKASDLSNGQDITQLDRYLNFANWVWNKRDDDKYEGIKAIILTPDYNEPTIPAKMKDYWRPITYRKLYNHLKDNQQVFANDINFRHFFLALERHTHKNVNDYLYYEMQEKFFNRIKQLKK